MKYKIGDKVKIKEDVLLTLPERADIHLKDQVGMIGKVIKIHEHTGENAVRVKPIDPKLKCKFWWNEDEQCPRLPEDYPSIKFDDNATDDEIDKVVRQAVFENFEWGFYEEETK